MSIIPNERDKGMNEAFEMSRKTIEAKDKEITILKGQNEGLEDALHLLKASHDQLKEQLKAKEEENEKLKEISNALVDELEGTTKTDFTFRIIDIARKLLNK